MNQKNTPQQPQDPRRDEASAQAPTFRQGIGDESGGSYLEGGRSEHDLDAHAPHLNSHDAKRISRLVWVLAIGFAALMAVLAVFVISRESDSSDTAKTAPKEESVVVPEAPQSPVADLPPITPIPLYPAAASVSKNAVPLDDIVPQEALALPRAPSLMERRMGSAESAGMQAPAQDPYIQAMLGGLQSDKADDTPRDKPQSQTARAQFLANPDALLARGTYLRCVLETRIVTDIKGFTSCIVTEPVYSITGRKLLIPKGSKISGAYDTDANGPRVSVIWDRIITPNGVDVVMSSPGVDNLGGAGHPGDYNAHWVSRMSSALMISLISDAFKYAGAKNGPTSTTVTNGIVTQEPFESNTARTMENLANQALERSINRPATVTIRQGVVVNIYVAQDVDFSGVVAGI